MKIVPLPKNAREMPYYDVIQTPLIKPTEAEIQKALTYRGDPKLGLAFEDRDQTQLADFRLRPQGTYLLPDGTIYMSATTPTPALSGEMLDWWMIWHQLEPLRYALWNPEDHYNVELSAQDRQQFLNSDKPYVQRIWNTASLVTESFNGEKPTTAPLHFVEPDTVGLKDDLLGTDGCMSMIIANNTLDMGPIKIPVFMTESVRLDAEGNKVWNVNAWVGHGYKNGKPVSMKLPMRNKIASKVGMLIVHSNKEIRHLNTILPSLYQNYSPEPLI
jgi:hypothetical protein